MDQSILNKFAIIAPKRKLIDEKTVCSSPNLKQRRYSLEQLSVHKDIETSHASTSSKNATSTFRFPPPVDVSISGRTTNPSRYLPPQLSQRFESSCSANKDHRKLTSSQSSTNLWKIDRQRSENLLTSAGHVSPSDWLSSVDPKTFSFAKETRSERSNPEMTAGHGAQSTSMASFGGTVGPVNQSERNLHKKRVSWADDKQLVSRYFYEQESDDDRFSFEDLTVPLRLWDKKIEQKLLLSSKRNVSTPIDSSVAGASSWRLTKVDCGGDRSTTRPFTMRSRLIRNDSARSDTDCESPVSPISPFLKLNQWPAAAKSIPLDALPPSLLENPDPSMYDEDSPVFDNCFIPSHMVGLLRELCDSGVLPPLDLPPVPNKDPRIRLPSLSQEQISKAKVAAFSMSSQTTNNNPPVHVQSRMRVPSWDLPSPTFHPPVSFGQPARKTTSYNSSAGLDNITRVISSNMRITPPETRMSVPKLTVGSLRPRSRLEPCAMGNKCLFRPGRPYGPQ